jgi:uncharacterized membrane protein
MIILVLVPVVVVNVVAKVVADNVVVYSAVAVAVAVLACSFSFSDSVDVNVFDLIGMDLVAFVKKYLIFELLHSYFITRHQYRHDKVCIFVKL